MGLGQPIAGKRARQDSENDNTTSSSAQPSSTAIDTNDEMWTVMNKRPRDLSPEKNPGNCQVSPHSLPNPRIPLMGCEIANIRANDSSLEFSNYTCDAGLDYTDGGSPGTSKFMPTQKKDTYSPTLTTDSVPDKSHGQFDHGDYTVYSVSAPRLTESDSTPAFISEGDGLDCSKPIDEASSRPDTLTNSQPTLKTGKPEPVKGPRFVIRQYSKAGRMSMRSSRSKDSVKSSSSSTTGTSVEESEVDEGSDSEGAARTGSNECITECDENEDDEIESDSYDYIPPQTESRCSVPGLRPSRFPFVPPYIHFCHHDQMSDTIPPEIRKKLKWRLSPITPIVVKKTVEASGFRLLRNTVEWTGQWGKHMKAALFRTTVKDYQKLNHLPGTFQIGRKDRLWRNLQRFMTKFGKEEYGFMPHTYVLPKETKKLKQAWFSAENKGNPWIVKPPAGARGTGIRVVNRWAQIPKKKPIIVQKYIQNPLLIDDRKFDLRLYVLVTNIHPLKIYLYNDGLVRFAPVKYSNESSRVSDRYMHLTNYSINKNCELYAKNEDADASTGHKWTLKVLWRYLRDQGKDVDQILANIQDIVIKTILCAEDPIESVAFQMPNRYTGYELFGFDVILDDTLKPWLLEVNISPSLHSNSPLDLAVKGPLIAEVFNIVGYHLPPHPSASQNGPKMTLNQSEKEVSGAKFNILLYGNSLSKKAKRKHVDFRANFDDRTEYLEDIINDLTPDDVRQLITAIDEASQCVGFQRLFPAPNSHEYFPYFEKPRYYNLLLDAWEHKYGSNPEVGIERLSALCKTKMHYRGVTGLSPTEKTTSNDPVDSATSEKDSSPTKVTEEEEEVDSAYGSSSVSEVTSGSSSIENLFVPTLPVYNEVEVVPLPSCVQEEDPTPTLVVAKTEYIAGIC